MPNVTDHEIKQTLERARAEGDDVLADWCHLALSPREQTNDDGSPLVAPNGRAVTRSKAREIVAMAIEFAQ